MTIDAKTTARIASLVKLDPTRGLSEAEGQAVLEKMTEELAAVIKYIDILAEADTSGVEPLYSLTDEAPVARADIPRAADSEAILAQAPDRIGSFFAVPKVL